jgi:hypothetical protein
MLRKKNCEMREKNADRREAKIGEHIVSYAFRLCTKAY